MVVLLGEAQVDQAEEPVQQGGVPRWAVGQEAETGGLQPRNGASPGLSRNSSLTCNPSLLSWLAHQIRVSSAR